MSRAADTIVDDRKCHFRLAQVDHDVASASDDDAATVFVEFGDQSHMILEIDVYEEVELLVRKVELWNEEAPLQRFDAGSSDCLQHFLVVGRANSADLDPTSIAQKLDD